MKNDVITLIMKVQSGRNKDGSPQYTEQTAEMFADVQSVKRSEFYAANRNGIDLDLVAVMNWTDFYGLYVESDGVRIRPSEVEFEGERYRIKRTYSGDKHKLELMLQKLF